MILLTFKHSIYRLYIIIHTFKKLFSNKKYCFIKRFVGSTLCDYDFSFFLIYFQVPGKTKKTILGGNEHMLLVAPNDPKVYRSSNKQWNIRCTEQEA